MKITKLGRKFVVYGPDLKKIPGTFNLRQQAIQAYQKYYKEWDAARKERIYKGTIVEGIVIDEATLLDDALQALPNANAIPPSLADFDPYVTAVDEKGEPLVTLSSGNVFEDLGLPDADKLLEAASNRLKDRVNKDMAQVIKKKPIRRKPVKKEK